MDRRAGRSMVTVPPEVNAMKRREFLTASAAFAAASAAGGFSCVEIASATPIEVPTIDKLSVRVLVDSASVVLATPTMR
jgi:7,8-dihydropterin-6-yl-methyl-4-(beta-D-ribofuranosyl)aminobenzene 5'-phosphate synthase